ncbi:MAG: non-ribosomal peptide synthetase, partial [Litorilinea sp.]
MRIESDPDWELQAWERQQAAADLDAFLAPRPLGLFAKQLTHPHFGPMVADLRSFDRSILDRTAVAEFEAMVARQPARLAVQDAQTSLTYGELNAAANRLARRLVAQWGAGPVRHQTIPRRPIPAVLLLEKSCDALVGFWAILKAGHPLMVLDLEILPGQIATILRDTGATYLLTRRAYFAARQAALPVGLDPLFLPDLGEADPAQPPDLGAGSLGSGDADAAQNLELPLSARDTARVVFTSGSTGKPKYTYQTHRGLHYSVWEMVRTHCFIPHDRHTYYQRMSSGAPILSLFHFFLSGGSIHLYDSAQTDPHHLAQWLVERQITHAFLPVMALQALLNSLEGRDCLPNLRMAHVTGQAVHRSLVELFQARLHAACILGCRYGMSDAGSIAHFQVDRDVRVDTPTVPAGHIYPGRRVYIVDEAGQVLAPDTPGEIVIGCCLPGFWDGYPIVYSTIEDPDAPGQRLRVWRTKDLGVMGADGLLRYLGRKDDLVKIRGFRVALTAVENALLQAPGVMQVVAKAFPTRQGDNRLVAYVVTDPRVPQAQHADYLRVEMAKHVEAHMIPARFVMLEDIPQTATAKPDRKALPEPANPRPELSTPYRAPQSAQDIALCTLWARELEMERVGLDDNFFDLGGDSILMMGLLLEAERQWQVPMPEDFFAQPTVATMVRILQQHSLPQA